MKRIFFLGLILVSFLSLAEQKHFYLVGAGGEPEGRSTQFDPVFKDFGRFINGSQWQTSISINGGHSKTESIISKYNNVENFGPYTLENHNKVIDDLKNKLDNNLVQRGDKLLIMINTHGARPDNISTSHKVFAGSGLAVESVSLDSLEEVVKRAESKGVKLAIVDFSCFSGNTLKLAGSNTCVISATGENYLAYSGVDYLFYRNKKTFVDQFTQGLREGANLEEIFLRARERTNSPEFPMISTPAGNEAQNQLLKILNTYLPNNAQHNNISDIYNVGASEYFELTCQVEVNYQNILNFINDLKKINQFINVEEMIKALEKYRSYQEDYESKLTEIRLIGKNVKEDIERNFPNEVRLFSLESGEAILLTDYEKEKEKMVQILESLKKGLPDIISRELPSVKLFEEAIKLLDKKISIAQSLREKYAKNLSDKQMELENTFTPAVLDKVNDLYGDVIIEANKVYNDIYTSQPASESNPCRDFVL